MGVYMKFDWKNKAFVFEGEDLEKYKLYRNKWIRLAVIGSVLPLALTCLIGWYSGKLELINLFGQGEIILSLFSLTVPLLFDLFEIKKSEDKCLSNAFVSCVLLVVLQIVFYCLIRIDSSEMHLLKGFWISIPFVIASWATCMYSIKSMFQHVERKEK